MLVEPTAWSYPQGIDHWRISTIDVFAYFRLHRAILCPSAPVPAVGADYELNATPTRSCGDPAPIWIGLEKNNAEDGARAGRFIRPVVIDTAIQKGIRSPLLPHVASNAVLRITQSHKLLRKSWTSAPNGACIAISQRSPITHASRNHRTRCQGVPCGNPWQAEGGRADRQGGTGLRRGRRGSRGNSGLHGYRAIDL